MSRDLTQPERDALEALIDAAGVTPILEALSGICDEKAEHIRANYEGESDPTARRWATGCGFIGCAAADVGRLGI